MWNFAISGKIHTAVLSLLFLQLVAAKVEQESPKILPFVRNRRSDVSAAAVLDDDKIYLNPRNAPNQNCPRNEEAARRLGRTCLRKCSSDSDCLSKKKVCLCDDICGMSCIKPDKECGELVNPMYGFVEVNGRIMGSKATYKCQKGYHLIGREERICQADGSWSRTPPECRENLYCTDPPQIANALYDKVNTQARFEVNYTIEYFCKEGFVTKGFQSAKCFLYNGTMQWFGPEIKCLPVSCGDPGEIVNGFKEGSCYSYSCRVTYYCRAGFELMGKMDHHCQQDGTWSPRELPSCKAVQCDTPENPQFGRAIFTTMSYNSVVTYECEAGYMIVGTATRRCGPDKMWGGIRPECKEINCGSPGILYNGYIDGSRTDLDARIKFQCTQDMTFEGEGREAICTSNGTWSTKLPKCLAPCIVPTIDNGFLNNTNPREKVSHGFELIVTCDPNYELGFEDVMPACYNGTWSKYPKCTEAKCRKLPESPRHGMVIAPRSDHGVTAKYRCKDGYKLEGDEHTDCRFGNWTGTIPRCQEIYCPFPGTIKNGRVLLVGNMGMYDYRDYVQKVKNNRQIQFKCNRGYYLVKGPPGATCVAGRWSPEKLPKCHPDLHPRLKWIRKRSIIDESDDNIHPTPPKFHALLTSEEFLELADRAVIDDYKSNQRIPRSINDETKDEEDISIGWTFMKDAESRPQPLDRVKRTLDKEERRRLKMELKEKRRQNRRRKVGLRRRAFAHCEELQIEPYMSVEIIRPGRDENYTYSSGARLHVTCRHGYGLNIGNRTAKCARGRWKPSKPECFNLPCSVPETEHGQFEYNGYFIQRNEIIKHGEVVKFSCDSGYNVLGSDTMRCWYGEWAVTGKSPECHATPCVLPSLNNGHYDSHYKNNLTIPHGASVQYNCDGNFVKIVPEIICQIGRLEPTDPACVDSSEALSTFIPQKKSTNLVVGNLQMGPELQSSTGRVYHGNEFNSRRHAPPVNRHCPPPEKLPDTIASKNNMPLDDHDRNFPDGTQVAFDCIVEGGSGVRLRFEWHCTDGMWVGERGNCSANVTLADVNYGNQTCDYVSPGDDKLVTFFDDMELRNDTTGLPPGAALVSRCIDIGKYLMIGSVKRRCKDGKWTGAQPSCHGLSQEHDYALDKPPTILFRHMRGPIAQSNDGDLLVYPGTVLHLECLWIRRYGTPRWNVSQTVTEFGPNKKKKKKKKNKAKTKAKKGGGGISISGKYPEGWTTDPTRNRQLEYRLSLYKAKADDSGTYICTTPSRKQHMVKIDVKAIHCPLIAGKAGLNAHPNSTKMSTKVRFSCDPGSMLVGPNEISCKPSGNWSAPHPHCESKEVQCKPPKPPKNGRRDGEPPYQVGKMVQISCLPNYMMKGHAMIVCQQDGQWSGEVPECVEACTYPGTIISGSMSSVRFYYGIGDKIKYTCSEGYAIHGAESIECLDGARWSDSVPTCLPTK